MEDVDLLDKVNETDYDIVKLMLDTGIPDDISFIWDKTMKIKLEYDCRYEMDEVHDVYLVNDDGTQTEITEPRGNDFEQLLIKMMLKEPPTYIEQFDE
jgi:hypothetical protein